jgi:hypothetical protein
MISSEVQRTLVKSPPELWAELSDPDALARHLGEFGEIHITRVDPEQKVEWEAGDTSGTVLIKPSGWGTKVKLTVIRELAEPDAEPPVAPTSAAHSESQPPPLAEPQAEPAGEPAAEPEFEPQPQAEQALAAPPASDEQPAFEAEPQLQAEPQLEAELGSELEPEFEAEPEPEMEPEFEAEPQGELASALELAPEPAREGRRGFFARLFGRLRGEQLEQLADETPEYFEADESSPAPDESLEPQHAPVAEPEYEQMGEIAVWATPAEPEPEPVEPQLVPAATAAAQPPLEQEPAEESGLQEQTADISAQIKAAEEVAADQVTAVLTGVLDRLGAAHHRPFSRS